MNRVTTLALALVVAAATLLPGCYRHAATTGKTPELYGVAEWHHHLFWGIFNLTSPTPLDQICPAGVAEVDTFLGPLQAVLSALTAGIWTPTTVVVRCAAGGGTTSVELDLSEANLDRLRAAYPDVEEQIATVLERSEPEAPVRRFAK